MGNALFIIPRSSMVSNDRKKSFTESLTYTRLELVSLDPLGVWPVITASKAPTMFILFLFAALMSMFTF